MTLTEYCQKNGSSRSSLGSVILEAGECEVGHWLVLSPVHSVRSVQVLAFDITYVQKNDSDILWTMDDHGNPRARSVFSLPLN